MMYRYRHPLVAQAHANRSERHYAPSSASPDSPTRPVKAPPAPANVELHAQIHEPVVAVDRRWCFATSVTLHMEENPLTRTIKVHRLDDDTKTPLLEIHRLASSVGDLFHVVDSATQEPIVTVDGFGFRGRFDVFGGLHEPGEKRTPGPILVDATTSHVTVYFDDAEARRPTRAIVDGAWYDRVAVVSIHHAVSSQAVARITRPHHLLFTLPYYTLEIAAGVDILVPLVLWLGRWVQFERARLAAAYPLEADWSTWSWV